MKLASDYLCISAALTTHKTHICHPTICVAPPLCSYINGGCSSGCRIEEGVFPISLHQADQQHAEAHRSIGNVVHPGAPAAEASLPSRKRTGGLISVFNAHLPCHLYHHHKNLRRALLDHVKGSYCPTSSPHNDQPDAYKQYMSTTAFSILVSPSNHYSELCLLQQYMLLLFHLFIVK